MSLCMKAYTLWCLPFVFGLVILSVLLMPLCLISINREEYILPVDKF